MDKAVWFLTNSNENSEIGGPIYLGVDVALNNFSISNLASKRNLRVNFGSVKKFESALPLFIRQLVAAIDSDTIVIKSERQIRRATNNIRLEYFMRGSIRTVATEPTFRKKLIYIEYPARQKKIFAQSLGWRYEKLRSKKKIQQSIITRGWNRRTVSQLALCASGYKERSAYRICRHSEPKEI